MIAPGSPTSALTDLPRWVAWRNETRKGKTTKVPFTPGTWQWAKTDTPETWGSYDAACAMPGCDGPGLVLTGLGEVAVLDLDHCRDPTTGRIEPWALDLCERAQSYVEVSPSGRGLHIIGIAHGVPATTLTVPMGDEGQKLEIFCGGTTRYTTVTWQVLDDYPAALNDIGPLVRELLDQAQRSKPSATRPVNDNPVPPPNGAAGVLGTLPNAYSRADWIRLGFAAKSVGGTLAEFDRWSATHPSYDKRETARVWESLKPNGSIGPGTIAHEARRHGVDVPKPEKPRAAAPPPPPQQGQQGQQRNQQQHAAPEVYDAADLRLAKFDPLAKIAGEVIVEGLTILAARPKVGKTWLALEIAAAVEEAGTCLGGTIACEQGEVLFLALEDNKRRMQRRLTKLFGAFKSAWPHITIAHKWPRADQGGVEHLRTWLRGHPRARLVVVDVLSRFRKPSPPGKQSFELDYEAVAQLQSLAGEFPGVAIVVVHHLRKSEGGDDPLDALSGTLGLNAAADAILIIHKTGQGTSLYGRSRDVDEIDKALKWDAETCRWSLLGERADVQRSEARNEILYLLAKQGPMKASDIADQLGKSRGTISPLLTRLVEAGEVTRADRGLYAAVVKGGSPRD